MARTCLAAAMLLGAFLQQGGAATIFSNVNGGNAPNTGMGIALGSNSSVAFSFTVPASQNYSFAGIDIDLESTMPGSSADVSLMADSGGLPGAVLESFLIANLPPFGTNIQPLESAASVLSPHLLGGTQYWVAVILPNDAGSYWIPNVTGNNGPEALQISGSGWMLNIDSTAEGAFRINGQQLATPEAATGSLLALGLVALGVLQFSPSRIRTSH